MSDTTIYVLPETWAAALESGDFTGLPEETADDVRLWRHYNPEVGAVEALRHAGRLVGSASSPHGRGPAFQDLQLCLAYKVTLDPAREPRPLPPLTRE